MRSFYRTMAYLVGAHVLGLLAMTMCRVVLLLSNMPAEGVDWTLLPTAMAIGVKFDNLIACYLSALPFVVLPILSLCLLGRASQERVISKAAKVAAWYYGVLYACVIIIEVSNARYFHFFENHLNISVAEWFGFVGDTAGLIFGDSVNWMFLAVAVLLIVLYEIALWGIYRFYNQLLKG